MRSMDSAQREVLGRASLTLRQSRNVAVAWARQLGIETRCDLTLTEWVAICESQRFRCAYCWGRPFKYALVMEHMIPLSRGGDHTMSNVVLACTGCNSEKSSMTPLEWACVDKRIMVRKGRPKALAPGTWESTGRPPRTYKTFVFRRHPR